jgi:hypothetical protein
MFSHFPVGLSMSAIWEKFPKFANDFQEGGGQDISRVSGGMP